MRRDEKSQADILAILLAGMFEAERIEVSRGQTRGSQRPSRPPDPAPLNSWEVGAT